VATRLNPTLGIAFGCACSIVAALLPGGRSAIAAAAEAEAKDEAKDEDEASAAQPGADACIDANVKADLFAKRRLRGTRERLFQQTNRHEIMLQGGYYVSDLFDGTYIAGAAYAYHMTEDLAVEASGSITHLASAGGPELERTFAVLGDRNRNQLLFNADLIWSLAHAKMRLGGSIDHFDLYVAGGAGVIDSALSSDLAGNAGFGLKFFLGRAVALRIDVRDYLYRQQLLSRKVFVNDVTSMLGLSLYLPLGD
jgi:outer membrane beta-barrel protein